MKVLVTGHDGYIGAVLVPMLLERGHDVTGLDSGLFSACVFGDDKSLVPVIAKDIRDVTVQDFEGFEAVIHLAALSNDPLGNHVPETTFDINHRGAVIVAEAAKQSGVERFLHSSTCSLYGAQGNDPITESGQFLPVTPYGESKVNAEHDISALAGSHFSPTFLRNATAYGYSAKLRGDLVVNNLVAYAMSTGHVRMKSDGTPWRPLAHIEDLSRAFVALMEADRALVHNKPYNVGRTSENYQIREVAAIVEAVVPNSTITLAETAGPDLRNYRVNCDLIELEIPAYQPVWTVQKGVEELYEAYLRLGLTEDLLHSGKLQRIEHLKGLIGSGKLGNDYRWTQ